MQNRVSHAVFCFAALCQLANLATGQVPIDSNGSLGSFAPAADVVFDSDSGTYTIGSTVFSGGRLAMVAGALTDPAEIMVYDFTSVSISAGIEVSATGSIPFAILSQSSLTLSGTIDLSGSDGTSGAGGSGGGAIGLFAEGDLTVTPTGIVKVNGGHAERLAFGAFFEVAGGAAGGGTGGAPATTQKGGAGGGGGEGGTMGSLFGFPVRSGGGGGGGGGAYDGDPGSGAADVGAPGDAGGTGNCDAARDGGDGGRGGGSLGGGGGDGDGGGDDKIGGNGFGQIFTLGLLGSGGGGGGGGRSPNGERGGRGGNGSSRGGGGGGGGGGADCCVCQTGGKGHSGGAGGGGGARGKDGTAGSGLGPAPSSGSGSFDASGGAGGAGTIVLASRGAISNSGVLSASGGTGPDSAGGDGVVAFYGFVSSAGTTLGETITVSAGFSSPEFYLFGGGGGAGAGGPGVAMNPGQSYCEGPGLPCPCGNPGAPGEGCAHSSGHGATVSSFGSSSVSNDDLGFDGVLLPPGKPCLLFVGTFQVNVVFGDGFRCVGGAIQRLGVRLSDGAGVASWGPGLQAQGGWSSGESRYFQIWFRDPAGPCGSGFNVSNAIQVDFMP